ncbi:MAG: HNH endonuclease [Candidatus Aminicenantes bacterium]|nr:HNH endonuclease [Candidatus Aminicenantes bacterium]
MDKVSRVCRTCGETFYQMPFRYRAHPAKYCSNACKYIGQIGKPIHSTEDRTRRRERIAGIKNPMFGRCREANPNWQGGRTVDNRFGYVLVLSPGHPRAHKGDPGGYVYEHVLVAEKKIGRFLTSEERVHHIDGNPKNNSPENIDVLPGDKEHAEIHNQRRKRNGLGQYS